MDEAQQGWTSTFGEAFRFIRVASDQTLLLTALLLLFESFSLR